MPKREQFVAVPGPRMMEAIGEVTVKWAALESMLDLMLYWSSDPQDQATANLLARASIAERWKRLKAIVAQDHANHPGSTQLMGVVDDALSVKTQRDALVHGLFADLPNNPSLDTVSAVIVGKKGFRDWKLNRQRILETATKIDELVARLVNLQLDHGERIGTSIRMNAWRHKDRLQD